MKINNRIAQLEIRMADKGKKSFEALTSEERQRFEALSKEKHYRNIRGDAEDYESANFKEWRHLFHKTFENRHFSKSECSGIAEALKEARLISEEEKRLYSETISQGKTPNMEQIIDTARENINRRLCDREYKRQSAGT